MDQWESLKNSEAVKSLRKIAYQEKPPPPPLPINGKKG